LLIMKIFIVIPLFNEEKHIVNVIKGLVPYKLPVIVVDDGSTDGSIDKIKDLTQGEGADKGHDYPSVLGRMVQIPVINAGILGNTTREELERLPRDVLRLNPQMVIITQRANDLMLGIPKEETLRNIELMIDLIQRQKAIAVLVTFEPDNLTGYYFKEFQELARDKQAVLIADVIDDVEIDPKYMHDRVHPNNEGYKLVAQRVYAKIKPFLRQN